MKSKFILISLLIFCLKSYATFDPTLQCPKQQQIAVIPMDMFPNPNDFYWWLAPLMPRSSQGGIGFGTANKAPLIMAEETTVFGEAGWACYYGSPDNRSLSELAQKKDQLPSKAKAILPHIKSIPASGFIAYVKGIKRD